MNKLEIYLSKDIDEHSISVLTYPESSNIINQFHYDSITLDNFTKAIDFIIAYFYKYKRTGTVIDINTRNNELKPAKEMTIKEIEKALGYKVKIVKEETL